MDIHEEVLQAAGHLRTAAATLEPDSLAAHRLEELARSIDPNTYQPAAPTEMSAAESLDAAVERLTAVITEFDLAKLEPLLAETQRVRNDLGSTR